MLVNFKSNYLTKNIITYIGNKRKLLIPISDIVDDITEKNPTFTTCLDAFSGSGVVSRLMRLKGFTVHANDLEDYTIPINQAFLTNIADPLTQNDYETLNSTQSTSKPYFSKYYAPADTKNPDLQNERLFYSQENAVFIDGILETIQDWPEQKKNVVLASLLFKMSKHNNTSGVMKGFYNGWGGSNGDNLQRILGKIQIDPIDYIDAPIGFTYNSDAENLYTNTNCPAVDITYLDPPYNGHQYSSNYHLLNSAVKYDFYDPGSIHLKKNKVGIRRDHNRSNFCYKDKAENSFSNLFKNIQSKYTIISYNNEGLLSIKHIESIAKRYFSQVDIKSKNYKKYAGGYGGYSTVNKKKVKEFFFICKK